MKEKLSHFFLPQESNNHRAKLLHHSSLIIVIALLLLFGSTLSLAKAQAPAVLGTVTDISPQELLILTNEQRIQNHVAPLNLNDELANAAEAKAQNMFANNYWAHFCPCGKSPWDFIHAAGYNYVYAGENLARGFSDSQSIITAWMNSTTHRENMLSPNYTDVGFAVEDGTLLGEQTTLVVEEFGSQQVSAAQTIGKIPAQPAGSLLPSPTQGEVLNFAGQSAAQNVEGTKTASIFNSFVVAKSIGIALLLLFIATLAMDAYVVHKKRITRIIGLHLDHVFFFLAILALILLIGKGLIV